MRPTRRGVVAISIAVGAVVLGAVARQPTWLVAGLGLGAVLVAVQFRFALAVVDLGAGLATTATPASGPAVVDQPHEIAVEAARPPDQRRFPVTLRPPTAQAARVDQQGNYCALGAGEVRASGTTALTWHVPGEFDVQPPTVFVADAWGLFETETEGAWADGPVTVKVQAGRPMDVHVGRQGELAAPGTGSSPSEQHGESPTPVGLREYRPGDPLRHVDWKATARLGEPHVREFETETDVATVIVFDHGSSTAVGEAGRTMLDYARELALSLVAASQRHREPLGLYAVGDEGLTHAQPPRTTAAAYRQVADVLLETTPTGVGGTDPWGDDSGRSAAGADWSAGGTGGRSAGSGRDTPVGDLQDVLAVTRRLEDDPSAYGRSVAPLLQARNPYEVATDRPLFEAVRAVRDATGRREVRLVVLTDDTDRPAVRRAITEATRWTAGVVAFLHPTVLFEPAPDLATAYDEYADFEAFRRELGSFGGVTALEVAPRERIDQVLAAGPGPTRTERGAEP